MIKIIHCKDAGFFSCCSVKLTRIIEFINSKKILPENVDSSELFILYKKEINKDITFDFFKNNKDVQDVQDIDIIFPINYHWDHQFRNYSELDYKHITPVIKKYFSPSIKINEIIFELENKYNIIHDNTIAVYYRGTDKYTETQLAPFDEFYRKILHLVNINENINILLQTDSSKFIEYIKGKKLKNVVTIDENKTSYSDKGIHHEQLSSNNYQDIFYFLSTILILSKCKYIICSSGNCSIWTMLYRGNNKNVIQYLNGSWYSSVF